jgi:hypothetical protein
LASTTNPLDGIPVRTERFVAFAPANQAQTILQNAIASLAQEFRNDELTDKLVSIDSQDSTESEKGRATTIQAIKDKMKDMMRKAIHENLDLGPAIDCLLPGNRDKVWGMVGDFYNHYFEVLKLPNDQVWYVD